MDVEATSFPTTRRSASLPFSSEPNVVNHLFIVKSAGLMVVKNGDARLVYKVMYDLIDGDIAVWSYKSEKESEPRSGNATLIRTTEIGIVLQALHNTVTGEFVEFRRPLSGGYVAHQVARTRW